MSVADELSHFHLPIYFLSLWKRVFFGVELQVGGVCFQHFTGARQWSPDFVVLEKSALGVAVPLKATPFFLWALEHFLLASGTRRAAETNVCFSFLSQWSDSWANSCPRPCQSVQSLSVWPVATPWTAARQASLSITSSRSLLKLMSIESVMPSNRLIFYRPLLLPPSVFASIRWPKYCSFSISHSSEYWGLNCFRMDWLDLLAVHGALKSLLQHHSPEALILQHSAFFMCQFSHPYMTTGKNIALTKWIFVGKVMSLLFNMLPRFVIAFLPRSKCPLISPSAVSLEPKKIKSVTVSMFPHLFAMKRWSRMPRSLIFECWVLCQIFHSPLTLSSRGSLVPTPGGISYSSFCLFSLIRGPIYSFQQHSFTTGSFGIFYTFFPLIYIF